MAHTTSPRNLSVPACPERTPSQCDCRAAYPIAKTKSHLSGEAQQAPPPKAVSTRRIRLLRSQRLRLSLPKANSVLRTLEMSLAVRRPAGPDPCEYQSWAPSCSNPLKDAISPRCRRPPESARSAPRKSSKSWISKCSPTCASMGLQ